MSDERRLQGLGKVYTLASAQRACFDKKRFQTRTAARDFNAKLGKGMPDRKPQTPYKCPVCGRWHLTSLTKQASAQVRRTKFSGNP